MRWFSCAALAAAIWVLAGCQRSSQEGQIRDLAISFVHETLALSPVDATSQGYHQHRGVNLDEIWPDYSPAGIVRARKFYTEALERVD
jgi:uncharacterized protein (DUF885 family)